MNELSELRKKVLELEKDNRLFKETEKKLQATNQQLQASEQQLRYKQETLIQTQKIARVGSWEWDVATDTVSWSDELFKIFRLNPEEGAISYADHPKYYTPDSMQRLDSAVRKALESGEPYEMDLEIIRDDGTNALCSAQGYAKKDKKGKVVKLFGSLQDITERKKIEWLLQPKKIKQDVTIPTYGDLTAINQIRTILDSVGKEVLNKIVSDYLSLLETSAAVYEKNGDYAVGIFSSEWCQFLDCSSRALCKTKDNKKALQSGKWLCHESCWADASSQSMQTNKAVDIECSGGLHIYAIPIRANNEVIGSINFGYGNPPTEEEKLKEIAANYNVTVDKLKKMAHSYETRPAFIIDIAKEKLETSAKLIGNIVERNQLEEELLNNQKRYQKAQAMGHVGNWEYDPVSTNFWASDEVKRIYGYDLDLDNFSTETVERCIQERERVHQALVDLLEHNKKYDLEFDIITYDRGIHRTIRSIAEVARDAHGNSLKVTGVISDITIQKKADDKLKALNQQLQSNEQQLKAANQQLRANEQQLRATNESLFASEKQFRNLFNSMQEGVYLHRMVYDEQGNAINYRIIEVNPISEEYLNIKREDAIGKLATELYETKEAPFIEVYAKVAETGKPVSFEQYFEPMNKYFIISIFSPIKGEFATIFQDITERKQSELDLIAAKEKAEESDRLKSAFLANMSHEIRTPMNGILGFANLLKEPQLSGLEQQKYINIIEKSGLRMLNIINDIIDIAKIEAGLMTMDITESNINEQIEYIYTFFKPEVEKKGIEFSFKNTLPAKEAIINTDREKIFAILTNLVKNAIKFTNEGSIEFGYNKNGDFIEFYVKDTGIGIPKERQSAIFERFIQADISDSQAKQGAGLGLSISKAYVEMLNGKMWVESDPDHLEGKGSIFYFSIPYNPALIQKTDNEENSNEHNLPRLELEILIVEDDETSCQLLNIILDKYAKKISNALNGKEAVKACRNNPDIDLILLDIQLPELNGFEVTRQIREFNKEVIIIAQTAYGLTGDREKALAAGCNDYISKPVNKEELKSIIQKHITLKP